MNIIFDTENEMCELTKALHNPNEHCMMLQNHAEFEDPFKMQERPLSFNVII